MRRMSFRPLLLASTIALAGIATEKYARAQEAPAAPNDDPLEAQRERFRAGLEKYRAGAFAEAILIWEPIYAELGPEKGYRLAFNLARAYEQFGNSTRAAESYEAYLQETSRRREAGETLEANVEKQEAEAKERLAQLVATQGRIRIAGDRAVIVKIDGGAERLVPRTGFVAYVTPNRGHTVTFDPGTKDEKNVPIRVGLGELIELAPPAPTVTVTPPREVTPPTPPLLETREVRPFSKTVLYFAAGVTVVSTVIPFILYTNALGIQDDYYASSSERDAALKRGDLKKLGEASANGSRLRDDYESARDATRATVAASAILGAATIGLTAYWLLGTKEQRVPISAGIVPGGAAFGATTRF